MLEAYTTLGYLAARTSRVELLAWVTGVVYREPGMLAKLVTTLDVLSERAGVARHRRGVERGRVARARPAVPAARRAVRAAGGGAADLPADVGRRRRPVRGQALPARAHAQLAAAVTRPHPPILIGGGGEQKTLRLVAQYADACNLFAGAGPGAQARRAARALRGRRPRLRRDREDRDDAARPGPERREVDEMLSQLKHLAGLGVSEAHCIVPRVWETERLAQIGREIMPAAAQM